MNGAKDYSRRSDKKTAMSIAAEIQSEARERNLGDDFRAVFLAHSDDGPGWIIERRREGSARWSFLGWAEDVFIVAAKHCIFGSPVLP